MAERLRMTPHLVASCHFLHRQVQFFHNPENRFNKLIVKETAQRYKSRVLTFKGSVQKS